MTITMKYAWGKGIIQIAGIRDQAEADMLVEAGDGSKDQGLIRTFVREETHDFDAFTGLRA